MKTAIVYDYLPANGGGGERALLELIAHFEKEQVEIFIGFVVDSPFSRKLLQNLKQQYTPQHVHHGPIIKVFKPILFRIYNFLLPAILQSYNFTSFDRVISYTAFLSHSITPPPKGTHFVYYNTPARFLWNLNHAKSLLKQLTAPLLITDLMRFRSRLYDLSGLEHNPKILAISSAVQERIHSFYNRKSDILFPPSVDEKLFEKSFYSTQTNQIFGQKYYVHVSRIESYKNIDLLIDLVEKHHIKENIVIIGTGPYLATLKKRLQSKVKRYQAKINGIPISIEQYDTIFFTGEAVEPIKFTILASASAFLSLNDEDFGITKVEALAVGTPIVAYAAGGALDIVKHGINGVIFEEPTADSLYAVLQLHRILAYDKSKIIASAAPFTIQEFHNKLDRYLNA